MFSRATCICACFSKHFHPYHFVYTVNIQCTCTTSPRFLICLLFSLSMVANKAVLYVSNYEGKYGIVKADTYMFNSLVHRVDQDT